MGTCPKLWLLPASVLPELSWCCIKRVHWVTVLVYVLAYWQALPQQTVYHRLGACQQHCASESLMMTAVQQQTFLDVVVQHSILRDTCIAWLTLGSSSVGLCRPAVSLTQPKEASTAQLTLPNVLCSSSPSRIWDSCAASGDCREWLMSPLSETRRLLSWESPPKSEGLLETATCCCCSQCKHSCM